MEELTTFRSTNGTDAHVEIRREIEALSTVTTGDMLFCGQVFRSRILQRTNQGMDVNGSAFVEYSKKGPYYLYVNKEAAGGNRKARATAAKGRHGKTGGRLTPLGIRYESYAAAKAAHGVSTVNEYGMEQHTHMLDTILVKAGGMEIDTAGGLLFEGDGPLDAFENNQANTQLSMGFYGPEAERARGQDEGNSRTPQRHFFGLNSEDLDIAGRSVGERMQIRARGIR